MIYRKLNGEEVIRPITFHADGWYSAGNFIFGGLPGYLLVNPLTGAMFTIEHKRIAAKPGQGTASNDTESGELKVMLLSDYTGNKEDLLRIHQSYH